MNRFGIIRHGSTAWNLEGRAQGNTDIPLNEEGISEAQKLAERLKREKWDILYSSDLLRAKQTAEIIKNSIGTPIQLDSRLREVGGGLIEGTTEEERISKWGRNWRELDLGIEHTGLVVARGLSIIEEINHFHQNQNILIVSHGSFIKQMLIELIPNFNEKESLKNTSLTTLVMDNRGWDFELYNCTIHII